MISSPTQGKKLLQLKNPWSHLRWKGRFSEVDTKSWTPELQKALNFDPANAQEFDNGEQAHTQGYTGGGLGGSTPPPPFGSEKLFFCEFFLRGLGFGGVTPPPPPLDPKNCFFVYLLVREVGDVWWVPLLHARKKLAQNFLGREKQVCPPPLPCSSAFSGLAQHPSCNVNPSPLE